MHISSLNETLCANVSYVSQWPNMFLLQTIAPTILSVFYIAYKSLVRPILEYGAACWDPYRECQISALDRVQNKAAKFAHHLGGSDGIFGAA